MKISGAVLAAGMSSRMRQNKLLLPYKNHTIIEEVLSQVSRADLDEIMIVTGHESERIEKAIGTKYDGRIRIIHNEDFRKGRTESIKRAVENISSDAEALLFMVGDKPTVRTNLIDKAILTFKEKSPSILYVSTPSGRGHPVIFGRKLFGELMGLEGDTGAGDLIAKYAHDVLEIEEDLIQPDIDSIADYKNLVG